jgi:thiosulfate dehydrogenase
MVHYPFVFLYYWTVRAVVAVAVGIAATGAGQAQTISPPVWTVPEVGALPDDDHGRLVRRGRDLITATYAHIGPEVPDSAKRFAGNNLACKNFNL